MCALGLLTFGASTAAGNGCITPAAGSPGDPFLIQDIGNLECLRDDGSNYWHRGYHFEQTANIDLTGSPWSNGIGDDSDTFDGTYNGNGFSIANLSITDDTQVGLFGVTEGAILTNVTLTNTSVTGTGVVSGSIFTYVGGLVGVTRSGTTINDSSVGGAVVSSGASAGGLVGEAGTGTVIRGSSSSAAVTISGFGKSYAGGLVGNSDASTGDLTITDSFATGDVAAGGPIGGLVGAVFAPATIQRSYATGDVSGATFGSTPGGGLVGLVTTDDTEITLIDTSFATGNISVTNGLGGGLVGAAGDSAFSTDAGLAVTDSFATGSVTTVCFATCASGGILGRAYTSSSNPIAIARTYSTSTIIPGGTAPAGGGILGVAVNPGDAAITASFWNPTDSGASATTAAGTESTRGAMTSASLYSTAGWSISDTAPAATTWVSCPAYNSGFPVLQWYAAVQGWSCSPTPPPVYPPTAPVSVGGIPGDASVSMSWVAPTSSGSFPISTYQALSTPSGGSCLSVTTTCEITGLTNGVAYSFRVRALNGAGWGSWSAPSAEITPSAPVAKSIVITGSRGLVRGRPGIKVSGSSTLAKGAVLRPWMKFPGQPSYTEGSARILIDANGDLQWQRRTGKKIYVFVSDDSARSNMVAIRQTM